MKAALIALAVSLAFAGAVYADPDDDARSALSFALSQHNKPASLSPAIMEAVKEIDRISFEEAQRKAQAPPVKVPVSAFVPETAKKADCGCTLGGPCTCAGDCPCLAAATYERAYHQSKQSGKTLVIFVRQPARHVRGCVVCRKDDMKSADGRCVVVGKWRDGKLIRVKALKGEPDAERILASLKPKPKVIVRRAAPQFFGGGGMMGGGSCGGGGCGGGG